MVREGTAEIRFIPGGMFRMGSDRHYPEEAPARQVAVADFWIDRTPVSNRQFRKFVNETGHVTLAELPPRRVAGQPGVHVLRKRDDLAGMQQIGVAARTALRIVDPHFQHTRILRARVL